MKELKEYTIDELLGKIVGTRMFMTHYDKYSEMIGDDDEKIDHMMDWNVDVEVVEESLGELGIRYQSTNEDQWEIACELHPRVRYELL